MNKAYLYTGIGFIFGLASTGWGAGIITAISRSHEDAVVTNGDFSWQRLPLHLSTLAKINPGDLELNHSLYVAYGLNDKIVYLSGLNKDYLNEGEEVIRKLCGEFSVSGDAESANNRRSELLSLRDSSAECLRGAVERR